MISTVNSAHEHDADGPTAWLPRPENEAKADTIFHYDLPTLNVASLSDCLGRSLDARGGETTSDLDVYVASPCCGAPWPG